MSFSLHAEAAATISPPPRRRTGRDRQAPMSLQAEQEGEYFARAEAADVEAALLLSLQEQEDVEPDAVEIRAVLSDEDDEGEEEEEKEEKKEAHPLDWHTPLSALLRAPLPLPLHVAVGIPRRIGAAVHPTRLQLLQLFLTADLVDSWAELTNAAAPVGWTKTDVLELLSFIGVHICMGIDSLPTMRMYWQDATRHPIIANLFSRDRFESLNRYLTVSERDPDAAPRNPFGSVRSFIAALNHSTSTWL